MSEIVKAELPAHLLTKEHRRDWIFELERTISNTDGAVHGDNEMCPLEHKFAEGCYVRQIFIPAGTLLTGKIHKHEHPNFLMSGEVSMITEEGGLVRMSAPQSLISPAGCKRAIFCHTDVTWTTVHVTDSKDVIEIEAETIAPTYDKFLEYKEAKELQ